MTPEFEVDVRPHGVVEKQEKAMNLDGKTVVVTAAFVVSIMALCCVSALA